MEQLISKKDVLERYGISYGALYRWKRMGLIPEEWFVKKSAVTGQETFFREDLICERIETILALKDTLSLEEIAKQLAEQSQKQRVLCLTWSGGSAQIPLSDLQAVILTHEDGQNTDLTEVIRHMTEGSSDPERISHE